MTVRRRAWRGRLLSGTTATVTALVDGGSIALDPDDAATDADAGSRPGPDSATCPAVCTSCTGSTCNIVCAGACSATIACPPGLSCNVTCTTASACKEAKIDCSAAASCSVACSAKHACVSATIDCGAGPCRLSCGAEEQSCVSVAINAASASSSCLSCRGTGGNPGCVSLEIAPPVQLASCTTSCSGGGCNTLGNGFNGCAEVVSCP